MSNFKKYQHIERYGTDEVKGIDIGKVWVFPKIDGTNASIWLDNNTINAGSRNRELTLDNDNAGFYEWVLKQNNLKDFFNKYPLLRLYGEWLVPHTLKTYRENAWREFYVFDVTTEENKTYLPYEEYKPLLEDFNINYIPPIAIIENGSYEQFVKFLDKNNYLIKDGKGTGEGIVLKNYEYKNKYGRSTWAKIVKTEFKEKNIKIMGTPKIKYKPLIEKEIAEKYCTTAIIDKVKAKIVNECDEWSSKYIPRLLNTVYHDIITEETWNFIKEYKNPLLDFKLLQTNIVYQIK